MSSKAILLLFVFLFVPPKLIFAHEDGHVEENHSSSLLEETAPLNDSIYSVDGEENTELPILREALPSSPFPGIDILGGETSLTDIGMGSGDPMKRFEEKTNSTQKHGQHEKQHIEEAVHEWVSPHTKGHRVAVGITIISGLAFMALSFFRIGEGNSKDPSQ